MHFLLYIISWNDKIAYLYKGYDNMWYLFSLQQMKRDQSANMNGKYSVDRVSSVPEGNRQGRKKKNWIWANMAGYSAVVYWQRSIIILIQGQMSALHSSFLPYWQVHHHKLLSGVETAPLFMYSALGIYCGLSPCKIRISLINEPGNASVWLTKICCAEDGGQKRLGTTTSSCQ